MTPDTVQYDRTRRPLELWSAMLAVTRHPLTFSEDDLEAALSLAMRCCKEGQSPTTTANAMYVIGRSLLFLRREYPDWSEWVAHAAVLAGEWALASGDETCQARSEALFTDYVCLLRQLGT